MFKAVQCSTTVLLTRADVIACYFGSRCSLGQNEMY